MSYQVIARKWRPQSFDQLVGQAHISQTLQNALKNGRLPHALLFTGPRGTGKTSSARILAKSLRCPNAKDFVPCNVCQDCMDVAASRAVDVIEIDGASNNGVDAIRELRDTVGYMPSSGKYKIYIIDEVHMLSTSAFNALLKTLEEPPAHVVFIMATTEAHKIPQTILSRCQRFDFRSISTRQITDHLKVICQNENVNAEEEALWVIARQGDGSMRDSQSLLDQVITFANGDLTRKTVIDILGLTDRAMLLETLSALVNRDTDTVIKSIEKFHTAGYDPSLFIQDLLENIRHLLLIKISSGANTQIIELPDSEIRFLKDLGAQVTEEDIHLLFDMALKGASEIPRTSEPRIVLEMVLLRMSQAPRVAQLQALISGAAHLPEAVQVRPSAVTAARKAPVTSSSQMMTPAASAPAPAARKVDPMSLSPQERWFEFVQMIKGKDALFAAKIEHLLFLGEKDKVLSLSIPAKMGFLKDQLGDKATQEKIQGFVDGFFGSGYNLDIQQGKQQPGQEEPKGTSAQAIVQQKQQQKEEDIKRQVADHPMIRSATAAIKGQIKSIKERP